MNDQQIQKKIQVLTAYAIVSSIAIAMLFFFTFIAGPNVNSKENLSGFNSVDSLHVKYISAERIDILEADMQLAISLSNSQRTPMVQFDGQKLEGASNRNIPNIVFFDGKGDEVGGLAFANPDPAGSPFQAIRHLAFDGYKQDEVITLSHFVQNGKSRKGMYIYDRPDISILDAMDKTGIQPEDDSETFNKKLADFKKNQPERFDELWKNPQRVALQTNENNQSEMLLSDSQGQVRLRLSVSSDGNATIEFLNEEGLVIQRIGPK